MDQIYQTMQNEQKYHQKSKSISLMPWTPVVSVALPLERFFTNFYLDLFSILQFELIRTLHGRENKPFFSF